MAQQFAQIEPAHRQFIEHQHMFFVATASGDSDQPLAQGAGRAAGAGTNPVAYLDLTGSGNETAAHLRADGRMTLMFCAFDGPPLILRLYGRGRVLPRDGPNYAKRLAERFDGNEPVGARQIVVQDVDLVQTSCGFGVPVHDYRGERPSLIQWAEFKGEDGLDAYRREKNARSIDGLPSGMFEEEAVTA